MTPKRVRSLPTVVWFTMDCMNFCMLLNLFRVMLVEPSTRKMMSACSVFLQSGRENRKPVR